jgi:hypothetical protein
MFKDIPKNRAIIRYLAPVLGILSDSKHLHKIVIKLKSIKDTLDRLQGSI